MLWQLIPYKNGFEIFGSACQGWCIPYMFYIGKYQCKIWLELVTLNQINNPD